MKDIMNSMQGEFTIWQGESDYHTATIEENIFDYAPYPLEVYGETERGEHHTTITIKPSVVVCMTSVDGSGEDICEVDITDDCFNIREAVSRVVKARGKAADLDRVRVELRADSTNIHSRLGWSGHEPSHDDSGLGAELSVSVSHIFSVLDVEAAINGTWGVSEKMADCFAAKLVREAVHFAAGEVYRELTRRD